MRTSRKRWTRVAVLAVIAGTVVPAVLRWVRRTGTRRRSVDMRMTVIVPRPIHDVFMFCRDFENFPRVLPSLLQVEDSQDGRSHWSARTPGGRVIAWDAGVTKYVPNSVIAWESAQGAAVEASGLMRFEALSPSETQVEISVHYRPMHTGMTDAFLALVGVSNATRVRSAFEKATRNVARRTALS